MRTSSNKPTRSTVPVLHPRKLTAFMLVCAFLFSAMALALPAAKGKPDIFSAEQSSAGNDNPGKELPADIGGSESPGAIPEKEDSTSSMRYRRRNEENGLNVKIYANADGTRTLEYYPTAVKYLTKRGTVRDILLRFSKAKEGGFVASAHYLDISLPEKLTEGITVGYPDMGIGIGMVPVTDTVSAAECSWDCETVSYTGENSIYEYRLTYDGLKEDIVVPTYTGETEYRFELSLEGLTPVPSEDSRNGHYLLADEEGTVRGSIGDILVTTADEKNNTFGNLTLSANEGGTWLGVISVDAEYLADERTVYPIRIDPNISIHYDENQSNTWDDIEDITVNQNCATDAPYSGTLYVGRAVAAYGAMRSVMRFPGLSLPGIPAVNITSAAVYLRDLMCYSTPIQVDCYGYYGELPEESFTISNITWESVNYEMGDYESTGQYHSSNTVCYNNGYTRSHIYEFDILPVVRSWVSYDNNIYSSNDHAIGFKSTDAYEDSTASDFVCFGSYDRAVNKPYLVIQYEEVSWNSRLPDGVYSLSRMNTPIYATSTTVEGGTYLSQTYRESVPASESDRQAMFKITYREHFDDYVIRSMANNEVVIYANIGYNAPLTYRAQNTDDYYISDEMTWNISPTPDGFYQISHTVGTTNYYLYMPSNGHLELATDSGLAWTKWGLHKYTGPTIRGWGQMGEWPDHIPNGTSQTIEAYIYSTVIGENRAWFNCVNYNPEVASLVRQGNSARLTITPNYGGNTKIQIEANSGNAIFGYYYLTSGWDNGNFFIQNSYLHEYLSDMGELSGNELRVTSIARGEYTLWNMNYYGDGYYRITQDITGNSVFESDASHSSYYGGLPDNSPSDLWKFIAQNDGTFKIQSLRASVSSPDSFMSLDNIGTKNIRSLTDGDEKQFWIIQPLQLNIGIMFDQAFIDRYGIANYQNVLDGNFETNSEGKTIISNFLDCLGFHASYTYISGINSTYLSYPYKMGCSLTAAPYIDILCKNTHSVSPYNCSISHTENPLADCEAGYHHKSGNMILDDLTADSRMRSTQVKLLFTGFNCCGYSEDGHSTDGFSILGFASGDEEAKCLVMDHGSLMRATVQHELVHVLGAEDCGRFGADDCIMGENQNDDSVIDNMILCDDCVSNIKKVKYQFHWH